MYSCGWREYMPDIGRWNGMDQLSESYHAASPYAYVLNNPINRYDPDGMRVRPVSGGYEFTGSDIGELSSYLGSGGNYRSLINSLSAWEGGGMGGSFWSFSGSYSAWGGSGDAGGNIYTTTAGNGAAGGSQNQIQEIIWTRTKMGSAQSIEDSFKATQLAWRQPGRAMMMGGFLDFMGLGDIAGAYIENNVSPENQRTGALGLFAVALALKKPGLAIKEEYNITSTALRSALSDRIGKRGFSEVGYQFSKHAGREVNGELWKTAMSAGTKNPAAFNEAGYKIFKEIWKSPGSFKTVNGFIEKRLPDGRGIRFQENWQFKGFLD